MEIINHLRDSKAQFMSLTLLVLFMLMVSELFFFVLVGINYSSLSQTSSLQTSSSNYANLLSSGATTFAMASGKAALNTLFLYEYNASLRKGNFIANFSQYMSQLMTSGTLPNSVTGSAGAKMLLMNMNNATFATYNSYISNVIGSDVYASGSFGSNVLGTAVINVTVNQTTPLVYQSNPYTLSIYFIENIRINASGSTYVYHLPINATIPLENTPDLLYAQEAQLRYIHFANFSNLTSPVGSPYIFANQIGTGTTEGNYIYGMAVVVPGGNTCGASLNGNVPSALQSAPYNAFVILASTNAVGLSNVANACGGLYGGLLSYGLGGLGNTQNVVTMGFPSTSNVVENLKTGEMVLLYQDGRDVLNIENLRNGIMDGYYYTSPFAPGYSDRVTDSFQKTSPNGMLTFSSYGMQAASMNVNSHQGGFNGIDQSLKIGNGNYMSVSFWMNWTGAGNGGGQGAIPFSISNAVAGTDYDLWLSSPYCMGFNTGNGDAYGWNGVSPSPIVGKWDHIVAEFYGGPYTGNAMIYLNGVPVKMTQCAGSAHSGSLSTTFYVGYPGFAQAYYLAGGLANLQIYNTSLSNQQVQTLYQRGLYGLPISSNTLSGWFRFMGNSNTMKATDYSGFGNNALANCATVICAQNVQLFFSQPQNYTGDAIFQTPRPSYPEYPIPGIGGCYVQSTCTSTSNNLPLVYLSTAPLGGGSGTITQSPVYTLGLNGWGNNYYNTLTTLPALTSVSIVGWVYESGTTGGQPFQSYASSANCGPIWASVSGATFKPYWSACTCSSNSCGTQYSDLTLPTNTWVMVAFTSNGNAVNSFAFSYNELSPNIYTNTVAVAFTVPSNTWFLGAFNTLNSALNGQLSNVQVYSTVLSKSQLSKLYQEGITGLPIQVSGLVAWWPLQGDANDYSGNGYNAVSANGFLPFYQASSLGNFTNVAPSAAVTVSNEWGALGFGKAPT